MLKSLVSSRNASPTEHIEAVTAERDFFREKYAAQMNEMEALKSQLKESQRVIDRLRKQVLDLEMGQGGGESLSTIHVSDGDADKLAGDGSNASLTSMNEEDMSSSSDTTSNPTADAKGDETKVATVQQSMKDEAPPADSEPDEDISSEKDEEDEADRIRANAERLLQWSDYQTRRSTLSPANTPSSRADEGKPFTYDVTDANNSVDEENDDSFSLNSPPSKMEYSSIDSTSKSGKMSKFLNNLKDIIDPPLDDVTDSDDERDESSDEESSIDHRSFDE